MSRVRRNVVPLVVVVMALAVGIAVGAGPLSDLGSSPPKAAAQPPPEPDTADDEAAAYADAFAGTVAQNLYAGRLHGHPVAVLALHGQLAPVVWAAARAAPGARIGYVQTAGGALPAGHLRDVAELRARGLLAGTVTAAPAYGGDEEAMTVAGQ